MIDPYMAVAILSKFRHVQKRADIKKNLNTLYNAIEGAVWLSDYLPVKLIAIPEGVLQGFPDEVYDMDHLKYYNEIAIDIPGEETDLLGEKAQQYNAFLLCQARAKNPDFPQRYFNCAFLLDPKGKVVLKYHKLQVYHKEHTTLPHDLWDKWIETYGYNLDAFYPVADTEIGKIGAMICYDGSFPEIARGLAMNGAEIIYRGAESEPGVGGGLWELQNRARALDNCCYVIAPNIAAVIGPNDEEIDVTGGKALIVDYFGRIIGMHNPPTSSWAGAVIDIESLRRFKAKSIRINWLKELRTEQYKLIYEQPIYPKNMCIDKPPGHHADQEKLYRSLTKKMIDKGIWASPSE